MRVNSIKRIAAAAMAFAMVCGCVQAAPAGGTSLWGMSVSAAEMTDAEKLADAVQKVESGHFGKLNGNSYESNYSYNYTDLMLDHLDTHPTSIKNTFIDLYLAPAFDGTGVEYSADFSVSNVVNKPEEDFAVGEKMADAKMVVTLTCGGETKVIEKTGTITRSAGYVTYMRDIRPVLADYMSKFSYTNSTTDDDVEKYLNRFMEQFNTAHNPAQNIYSVMVYGDTVLTPSDSEKEGSIYLGVGVGYNSQNWTESFWDSYYFTVSIPKTTAIDDYLSAAEKAIDEYYGSSYPSYLDDYSVCQRVMEALDSSGIAVDVKSSEATEGSSRVARIVCTLTLGDNVRKVEKMWTRPASTDNTANVTAAFDSIASSLNYSSYASESDSVSADSIKSSLISTVENSSHYEFNNNDISYSYKYVEEYGISYDVKITSFEKVENTGTPGDVSSRYTAEVTLKHAGTGLERTVAVSGETTVPDIAWFNEEIIPFVDDYMADLQVSNSITRYDVSLYIGKIRELYNAKGGEYTIYNTPIVYQDEDSFVLTPATEETEGSLKIMFGIGANNAYWTKSWWGNYEIVKTIPKLPSTDTPGNITSEPVVEPGAPATDVTMPTGTSASDMVELTPEETAALQSGSDIKLVLSVAPLTPDDTTKAAVESAAAGMTVGLYIDLSVTAKTDTSSREVGSLKKAMTVTVQLPAALIEGVPEGFEREYYIVHAGDSTAKKCSFDSVTGKISFSADAFSPYAVVYKDVEKEKDPEPAPAPVVYNVNVIGGNARVEGSRTAGSTMTVTVPIGYDAYVMSGANRIAVISDGTGTFTMPSSDVVIRVEMNATMANMVHYPNSYIFCYDSEMNHIKTNSSRYGINGTGDITVKLGSEYAGRNVTLYTGRKSTANKTDEGVLDSNGRCTFTVEGGKNFTLIVED